MRRWDYLLLVGFVALVAATPLTLDRILGNHETVHAQNLREMLADGDWLIPHYGGRPWLERPPLPFWISMPVISLLGDSSRVFRLVSVLVGLVTVLLTGWMAGLFYGRAAGLLAGCILATMYEFVRYTHAPESDIFVCSLVAIGLALFAHLEFQRRPDPRGHFLGARPWALVAFFVVLGLGNLVKGLYFADMHILVPVAAFLLFAPARWEHIKRYVWLPGWVAFLVAAGFWAGLAYWRQPDIVDLWASDYLGRIKGGYMREPWWYYGPHLLLNLLPWTPLAFVGLGATASKAWNEPRSAERFLWCWALGPVLVLSIPQGKHHHYLLSVCAPWAILAALGAVQVREWLLTQKWLHRAALPGALVSATIFVVVLLGFTLPPFGPWLVPTLVVAPVVVFTLWWASVQRDARLGLGTCVALAALVFAAKEYVDWKLAAGYRNDLALIEQAKRQVPADQRVLVLDNWGPLDASWSLYYLQERAQLLHNATFLRQAEQREVYVLSRPWQLPEMEALGRVQVVRQSERSRNEKQPEFRLTLYRVTLHEHVALHRDRAYISPMQATGRAEGPYLK
jgi:4-amino-4-deoxy-L-arabinose transferase-like glycosyltransferase